MAKKTSYTIPLTPDQQEQLATLLRTGNYRPRETPYTIISVEGPDCNIALYTSGKCVVQGQGAEDWVTYTLEPQVLLEARLGYESVHTPEMLQPHLGVDESGKGDFFGPLVIAAAYVDEKIVPVFKELNVRDSKQITSDKKAEELADQIADVLGNRFALVTIGPAPITGSMPKCAASTECSLGATRARSKTFSPKSHMSPARSPTNSAPPPKLSAR